MKMIKITGVDATAWKVGQEHEVNGVPHIVTETYTGQGSYVELAPRDEYALSQIAVPRNTRIKIGKQSFSSLGDMTGSELLEMVRKAILATVDRPR